MKKISVLNYGCGNLLSIGRSIKEVGYDAKIIENKADVEKLYQDCNQSDLIVTIGGVSKGDFDLIRDAITEKGNINFWGIILG